MFHFTVSIQYFIQYIHLRQTVTLIYWQHYYQDFDYFSFWEACTICSNRPRNLLIHTISIKIIYLFDPTSRPIVLLRRTACVLYLECPPQNNIVFLLFSKRFLNQLHWISIHCLLKTYFQKIEFLNNLNFVFVYRKYNGEFKLL